MWSSANHGPSTIVYYSLLQSTVVAIKLKVPIEMYIFYIIVLHRTMLVSLKFKLSAVVLEAYGSLT